MQMQMPSRQVTWARARFKFKILTKHQLQKHQLLAWSGKRTLSSREDNFGWDFFSYRKILLQQRRPLHKMISGSLHIVTSQVHISQVTTKAVTECHTDKARQWSDLSLINITSNMISAAQSTEITGLKFLEVETMGGLPTNLLLKQNLRRELIIRLPHQTYQAPVLQGLPISPHLRALLSFHISRFILFSSFCIPEFILFRPTWRKNEVLVSHGFSNCGGSNSKFWKQ